MEKNKLLTILLVCGVFFLFGSKTVSASPLTQGQYAIQLAGKLGLGEGLSVDKAIAALTNAQIVPQEGWRPEEEVTAEFAQEVLTLVVEAARKGLISISAEDAANIVGSLNISLGISPPPPPPPPPPPVPPASPSE